MEGSFGGEGYLRFLPPRCFLPRLSRVASLRNMGPPRKQPGQKAKGSGHPLRDLRASCGDSIEFAWSAAT